MFPGDTLCLLGVVRAIHRYRLDFRTGLAVTVDYAISCHQIVISLVVLQIVFVLLTLSPTGLLVLHFCFAVNLLSSRHLARSRDLGGLNLVWQRTMPCPDSIPHSKALATVTMVSCETSPAEPDRTFEEARLLTGAGTAVLATGQMWASRGAGATCNASFEAHVVVIATAT